MTPPVAWRHRLAAAAMALVASQHPANALTSCSAIATPLSFGTYSPSSASSTDITATVTVNCTVAIGFSASWTVALSTGSSASYASRAMLSAGNTLSYQIYSDAARTQIWGDGSSSTTVASGSFNAVLIGTNSTAYTAYGRIPARQNAAAGIYLDTILVTVTY